MAVVNPLADLCARMGLIPETVAKLAGVSNTAAREALSPEPNPAVANYLAVAAAIGAKFRIRPAPPLSFWIDADHLNRLYADRAFRAGRDLPALPATRGELRDLMMDLRRRLRKSLGGVVAYMEAGHIPTAAGLPVWRRGTVAQYQIGDRRRRGRALPDDGYPLVPSDDALAVWREYLVMGLLSQLCPADPFWVVKYALERREEAGRVVVTAGASMPEVVRTWVLQGLAGTTWLDGQWGVSETPPPSPPP